MFPGPTGRRPRSGPRAGVEDGQDGPGPVRHPEQALLVGEVPQGGKRDPAQIVRLVADPEILARFGDEEKAQIVVVVGGLRAKRRDRVDVEVEDPDGSRGSRVQSLESGLLARLAQGDPQRVGIAVGMAAQLEPSPELAVMGEQHLLEVGRNHPGGAGDVARKAGAFKAVGPAVDEAAGPRHHGGVAGVTLQIGVEQVEDGPSMHAFELGCGSASGQPRHAPKGHRPGRSASECAMQIHRSEHPGGVRLLRIERPPANAINGAFLEALHAEAVAAGEDESVHALVVTGSVRFFSAGLIAARGEGRPTDGTLGSPGDGIAPGVGVRRAR